MRVCPAASGPSRGDAVPPEGGGRQLGALLGEKSGGEGHRPTATEASLLRVAILLHYSATHFHLH